jgi:hypothetical protein
MSRTTNRPAPPFLTDQLPSMALRLEACNLPLLQIPNGVNANDRTINAKAVRAASKVAGYAKATGVGVTVARGGIVGLAIRRNSGEVYPNTNTTPAAVCPRRQATAAELTAFLRRIIG